MAACSPLFPVLGSRRLFSASSSHIARRHEGEYHRVTPGDDGIVRSQVFPGLWLDVPALLRGDLAAVLSALQRGLATSEHAEFVKRVSQHNIA
jgi:hypothetical protein